MKDYIEANHLSDKSDSEFTLYKMEVAGALQDYHIMILDQEYYSEDFSISRNELHELNKPIFTEIRDEVYRLFDELRDLSRKYN